MLDYHGPGAVMPHDPIMTIRHGLHARRPSFAIAALLVLFLAGGCAAVPQLAWQRADDLIVNRINEWLDLEPGQEQRLRQRLEPWLRDVREKRLPEYAESLRALAERVDADIDAGDVRWATDRFETLYTDTMRSFLPVISPTLAELSPAQQRHLANRMEERNRDFRDDYIEGRDEGRYAVAERIIEAVEHWTGSLDSRQQELVHNDVRELPHTPPVWFDYRRSMQQQLLAQVEDGTAPATIEQTLQRWWIERGRNDIPQWHRMEKWRSGLRAILLELGRSLTALQRAEARRHLRSRADSLEIIAAGAD